MRLKEIEARLAEIKEELNTRAAELTDEEITKLETEVTDLQEERTALLTAAEKRKKLLERIAAGEPTGGAGADTTLLRNFKGAGGTGAGETEDKYDTMAYRKAFMNYVCRGVANIRTGAGTNYAKTGETTGKGVFTIVEVKAGQGASAGWGRLKSGAGWISLDYATRLA